MTLNPQTQNSTLWTDLAHTHFARTRAYTHTPSTHPLNAQSIHTPQYRPRRGTRAPFESKTTQSKNILRHLHSLCTATARHGAQEHRRPTPAHTHSHTATWPHNTRTHTRVKARTIPERPQPHNFILWGEAHIPAQGTSTPHREHFLCVAPLRRHLRTLRHAGCCPTPQSKAPKACTPPRPLDTRTQRKPRQHPVALPHSCSTPPTTDRRPCPPVSSTLGRGEGTREGGGTS